MPSALGVSSGITARSDGCQPCSRHAVRFGRSVPRVVWVLDLIREDGASKRAVMPMLGAEELAVPGTPMSRDH
jgi:hypothetical protein